MDSLRKMRIWWPIEDMLTMVERNITRYRRVPQLLIFSTIEPVMFLLLFAFVFGGAIQSGEANYIQFLLPGVLVQVAVFGALQTGVGLAEDLNKGLIDRFRSLPMARSAVLTGRTISDMMRNVFTIALMFGVGCLIGFRLGGSWSDASAAYALLLLFAFAFSWISATIGMAVRNTETAQVVGFIWVFPLVFISAIYVPVESMPHWLQYAANYNPVTVMVHASRALLLGNASAVDTARYAWGALGWIVILLAIFMPLAIRMYRKTV